MRIQHNILAMNAYRNYNTNTSALAKNLEKLSSGYKINRAGDDAAGLAISEKMRAQITGLNAAQKNVKDGISLVKTAEGAMQEIQDMLNRMDYLATQSANGTYDNEVDRLNLQKEVDALKTEINRIADSANFNGINLLDGSLASTSISAVGSLDNSAMINGTAPTPGGKAQVTVTLNSAKVISTQVDASNAAADTFDGVDPTAATGDTYAVTVADTTGGTKTEVGNGADKVTLDGNTTVTALLTTAKNAAGDLLADKFDITVKDKDGNELTGNAKITTDSVITFTAKNKGASGAAGTATEINVTGQANLKFTPGVDEGAGGGKAEANYEIKLNLTKLEGGQFLQIGNNKLTVSNKAADTGHNFINISGKDLTDDTDRQAIGAALETNLKNVFANFNANTKVTVNANGIATIKMVANDNQAEAGNLGEVRFVSNSGTYPMESYTYNKYSSGANSAAGKYAQVTYSNDALKDTNLKTVGAKLKIGGIEIEVVDNATAAADMKDTQIKVNDVTAAGLQKVIEQQAGTDFGLVTYDATNGKLTITANKAGAGQLDALKAATKVTVEKPDTTAGANPTTIGGTTGGQDITPGTTTLADLKNKAVDGVKLGDIFDIQIEGKTDADTIALGDKITYTAKQTGKLDDKFMKAITYSTGAASEVRDGWDEGTDGAGNNTHYELNINTGKLVGGQSFTFGTGSKTSTFDITYDDVETDNGTVTTPGAGTEVGKDRTKINLSKSMSDQEIADAIKTAVGTKMTDFNVKVEVSGSNIKLSMDAKKATEDTNLGGVRYSSASGAFTGAVYKAYNAFDGGTEGTYAQVSYDFNLANLKSGDSLTIGDTTIKVGDKTATEKNLDGSYNITLSEADAQNAEKLVKAFESAGYQSGQLSIAGGKLTITGTEAGQTADALSKAGGRVSLTSTRTLVSGGLTLQIGDTSDDFNQMNVAIGDMHTKGMGIDGVDISKQDGAKTAIQTIKNAINYVSGVRGDLGATQNRLEHTANNLSVMAENIQDAESTIRDTDIAEEMMAYTKNNILIQSAQAMLAQANAVPQGVLQLLG